MKEQKPGKYWDRAWSLVEGCMKIDKECENCWSEEQASIRVRQLNPKIRERYVNVLTRGKFNGSVNLMWNDLYKPTPGQSPAVWSIWNDLFHHRVPFEFQYKAIERIHLCQQHTFIACTKRPHNAIEVMDKALFHLKRNYPDAVTPLPNLVGMTTAGYQSAANARIPELLRADFALRAVSMEPMLGPINLDSICVTISEGEVRPWCDLDVIILGGETGRHARPLHPDWARGVRDQCERAGVPFYFKKWGEWYPVTRNVEARIRHKEDPEWHIWPDQGEESPVSLKVPRGTTERLLDGVEHNALPWREKDNSQYMLDIAEPVGTDLA